MHLDARKQHIQRITRKYHVLGREFDERQRRLWASTEAAEIGRGGLQILSEVTKLSVDTIRQGLRDISRPGRKAHVRRIRVHGAGRKKHVDKQPELMKALNALIEPTTRGDPESPLRWTCKSTRILANELMQQGFKISHRQVGIYLKKNGYTLQSNFKTLEGQNHPDRNQQFEFINAEVEQARSENQPAISVDTKKKEIIGNYKNNGQEWSKTGNPEKVNTHDFADPTLGKAVPYGVYDIDKNHGWVSVGMSADTAEFAVASIEKWWTNMGQNLYPNASELVITADAGGSNGYRVRLWKYCLQKFSNTSGLRIKVRHFPPGTSKWNKIEHRMFCHMSANCRARPLVSHAAIVSLTNATKTQHGLVIKSALDQCIYTKGVQISNDEMAQICLETHEFHGEWNYTIVPAK